MKTSPETIVPDVDFTDQRNLAHETGELVAKVRADQMDMQDWMSTKLGWWERRYSRHDRNTVDPWPGASDVWLPLTDLYVGQIKPLYMNMLFGGPRTTTMRPLTSAAFENAPMASMMMEHIVRGGGIHAMKDAEIQLSQAVDSMCTLGIGILKTHYDYRTRITTETLRKDSLKGILSKLIIKPRMSEAERRQEQARFSGQQLQDGAIMPQINGPEILAIFGEPVNPMNSAVFSKHAKLIESEVVRLYRLDPEEKADAAAIKEIMAYLRSGTREHAIAITKREVIHDGPVWSAIPLQSLIVPPGALLDLSRAERVTHEMLYTESALRQAALDNAWAPDAVDVALDGAEGGSGISGLGTFDEMSWAQEERERNFHGGREEELFRIWETTYYDDISEKGLPELVRIVYEPNSGAVLKKVPFPHDHGEIPFTALPFEVNEATYRSPRGVAEILDDIESHVSGWHRHLENNMTISTSTSLAVARDTFDNPNDITLFPGIIIPTSNPQQDIAPIIWPQTDVPIERLEQFYMLWPERLIGGIDNQNLLEGGAPERRTATEVQSTESARQRLVGMRGTLFLAAMRRPLNQLWRLWRQHGPREVFVQLTGEDPQTIVQSSLTGDYDVVPVAAVGDMDPNFRRQRAQLRLQEAIQIQPLLANDPRYEVDIVQTWVDKVMEEDPLAARRMVSKRSDAEIQQILQKAQQDDEQLQQLKLMAQKAMENTPLTTDEIIALQNWLGSQTGRGALQQVVDSAQASEQRLQQVQAAAR